MGTTCAIPDEDPQPPTPRHPALGPPVSRAQIYTSHWHLLTTVWRASGPRGYFQGLSPTLAQVVPNAAVTVRVVVALVEVLLRASNVPASERASETWACVRVGRASELVGRTTARAR